MMGVDANLEMHWEQYSIALLIFNLFGILVLFVVQMVQAGLPLNPQHLPGISWHSSFNTAVSFVTNTNWQGYSGETTMSYLTRMVGLAVQNFSGRANGIGGPQ